MNANFYILRLKKNNFMSGFKRKAELQAFELLMR